MRCDAVRAVRAVDEVVKWDERTARNDLTDMSKGQRMGETYV